MRKRLLSILLLLVPLLASVSAYAASDRAVSCANALYQLGLFNGTGKDEAGNPVFQLERQPTRNKAVTMLVRLLGKEEEALSQQWSTPFTDLDAWVKPYVGYAYQNGLTSGTSGTTFGGNQAVTAPQYITFVLRALGYQDGTHFQWDQAWQLSDQLGFTSGQYSQFGVQEPTDTASRPFLRGDVAVISYNALLTKRNGTDTTLLAHVKGGAAEHTHTYLAMTALAGGHYQQVQVGTEKVYLRTEKRQYSQCLKCGAIARTTEEIFGHYDPESPYFSKDCVLSRNMVYDEFVPVYEEQPKYETQWVEDASATLYLCSICGQQQP